MRSYQSRGKSRCPVSGHGTSRATPPAATLNRVQPGTLAPGQMAGSRAVRPAGAGKGLPPSTQHPLDSTSSIVCGFAPDGIRKLLIKWSELSRGAPGGLRAAALLP